MTFDENKLRKLFKSTFGRYPTEAEIADAKRGYLDEQKRTEALEAAELSADELRAAYDAELRDIYNNINGSK